jgi:hypothetical protein
MPGWVGDQRVADLTGATLAASPLRRRRAGVRELAQERVAGTLELLGARDPGFRRRHVARVRQGLEIPLVARELRLEPADLAAKLLSGAHLVRLQPRVVELELGGELFQRQGGGGLGVRIAERDRVPGKLVRAAGRKGGSDHRNDRDLARIHPRLARRLDRLARDPLDLRRAGRVLRDEAAGAVPGEDQPLVLELRVDAADRVHVDPGPSGQRAHARQPLAGLEAPGDDQRAQAPGELDAERELVGGVGGEGGGRRAGLCHVKGTVASYGVLVNYYSLGMRRRVRAAKPS